MSDNIRIQDREFELYISADRLNHRVRELAQEVSRLMGDGDPICLIALKGGFIFAADLLRALSFDPEVEFIGL